MSGVVAQVALAPGTSGGPAERFTELHGRLLRSENGDVSPALAALRRAGLTRFTELGFPSPGDEEWRFTDVRPHLTVPYGPVPADRDPGPAAGALDRLAVRGLAGTRAVFVDGVFAPSLSTLPPRGGGLRAGTLRSMIAPGAPGAETLVARLADAGGMDPGNAFTALNEAFVQDGFCLELADGYRSEEPVSMLYLSTAGGTPVLAHPRNLVVAGADSRVAIVEEFVGAGHGSYFTNAVTGIHAAQGASVEYDRFQHEGDGALHVSSVYIRQEGGSAVTVNTVAYGAAMARQNIHAVLAGEGADCTLNGLTLTTGAQHIDNHTTIDHATPRCSSHELYKAILEGSSRGVFNGKIYVRRDAQKTDARQTNKTLLLSENATIDAKPQLEIFADDVKCTHGATVGQLDDAQVFYLRSRGMGLDDARDLLTNAFASDVLNRIRLEPLREHLQAILHVRLCRGRMAAEAQR